MEIPSIGFGTFKLKGDDAYQMTLSALKHGYRHIDTAKLYGNEREIGRAIKDSGIDRKEIFITTKIWRDDLKNEHHMTKSVKNSLMKLDVDYIDLVIIHAPPSENYVSTDSDKSSNSPDRSPNNSDRSEESDKSDDSDTSDKLITTWRVMEDIIDNKFPGLENKIRHIGVSNYKVKHLERILKFCKYKPYTNQIEISPYLTRNDLIQYCHNNGIKVVAHTSLIKGQKFDDEKLINLSKRYEISMPLLLLGWALAKKCTVLPRSSNLHHMMDNFKCLDIKLSQNILDELDTFNENFATHPQYLKE